MYLLLNNIYTVIFYIIMIVAVTAVVINSFWAGLLFLPLVILGKYMLKFKFKISIDKHSNQIWFVLQMISAALTVIMASKLEVNLAWDWGQLITTASFFVLNQEWQYIEYFARYPNNQFWLTVLIYIFTLVKAGFPHADFETFKSVSVLLGCCFIQGTIFMIYKIASLIWNQRKALFVGIITIACVPFYLYAQFTYTDLPALFLISITCYLYIKKKSKQKVIWFIILGIIAALVYQIKVLSFIVFIALMMDYLITTKGLKVKIVNTFSFLVSFIIIKVILSLFVENTVLIPEGYSEKYEFPPIHWVMMGIYGTGGYYQEDVEFSKKFDSYEEKVSAGTERFIERVQEKELSELATHILKTKVVKTWGDPTYHGSVYTASDTIIQNGKFQRFFTINGDWYWIFNIYASIYHIAILLGLFLVGLLTRKENRLLFMKTALIGIVVFLSIWECNSRYLLSFLPIIIILSCEGWFALIKRYKCI